MNKFILITCAFIMMVTSFGCRTKSPAPVTTCTATISKFLADGTQAEYKLLFGGLPGDTSVKVKYAKLTADIFQQTYNYLNINGTTKSYVRNYFKACGGDIYLSNDGYTFDNQVASQNIFIKANRIVGSQWNHVLNGEKFWIGCVQKAISITTPYGVVTVDKLFIRNSPAAIPSDTMYWDNTIGIVAYQKASEAIILMNKNY